jgi:phosphotransferase system HPr (HPr) family protein
MVEIRIAVTNPHGLHARPAAVFVRAAAGFRSTIRIKNLSRDSHEVDAKSLLSVLAVGVSQGHEVLLRAEGTDADEAIAGLSALLQRQAGDKG